MNDVAIVHNRVDALYLAFRVTIRQKAVTEMRRAGALAQAHGKSACSLADHVWELKIGSVAGIYHLRRDQHVRIKIDQNASGGMLVPSVDDEGRTTVEHEPGWTVEIIFYAAHLADVGPQAAAKEAEDIARGFGIVHDARIRRLDLAADIAGWRLMDRDRRAFVRRSRVRTSAFSPSPMGYKLRAPVSEAQVRASATLHETRAVTGFTVGRGDVVARIYDKREELSLDASKHKAPAEEERWRCGGWDGEARITRVEFQLRGEALKELGARALHGVHDPQTGECFELHEYLPRIWASCLQWVRLVQRQKTRTGKAMALTRCPDDARWAVLRKASWGYAAPIRRKRERGGASTAQALGSVLSVAAARGRLEQGLPESKDAWKGSGSDRLREILSIVSSWGVDLIAADMIERWGSAEDALIHVAVLWNAARARFARIHEREKIPWQPKSNREPTEAALSLALPSTDSASPISPSSRWTSS